MPITVLPVIAEPPQAGTENETGKVGNHNPWKNQKPGIICHQLQVRLTHRRTPSDKKIPCFGFPCRRTKQDAGQGSIISIKNDVLDVFTDMSTAPKIMVAIHQAVKQIVNITPFRNHLDLNWTQLRQFTVDRITTMGKERNNASTIVIVPGYRQRKKLALFEFSQHRTAGHILEQSLVRTPVP